MVFYQLLILVTLSVMIFVQRDRYLTLLVLIGILFFVGLFVASVENLVINFIVIISAMLFGSGIKHLVEKLTKSEVASPNRP